jgi:hypothetical protein
VNAVDAVRQIDRDMDRFLDGALAHDVALLREHGATNREVRKFCRWKRDEYEAVKQSSLAELIAFVLDRPIVRSTRLH